MEGSKHLSLKKSSGLTVRLVLLLEGILRFKIGSVSQHLVVEGGNLSRFKKALNPLTPTFLIKVPVKKVHLG